MARQVPISFKDLAVRFSEEEWRLLQEGQREFYRDVMRENYETLVSVGTAELLPLSDFLSPMEPKGATGGESHPDEGQKPLSANGFQGGQPQHSLHLTALVQLVKEIPEYLFKEVKGTEDSPESTSLDGEKVSSEVAVTSETSRSRGLLSCLPESPVSQPSLATTPTGSSSSSGPPGDWAQGNPLPIKGTAGGPQPTGKESPGAPGNDPSPPTCSLDQRKSYQRQERGTPGPGPPPGSSPLQGLINCLKEILVPGPQQPGTAPTLLPSLPGLSVLRQNRTEVGSGSPPWPVKTEAAPGDCPLQGLLKCLKEIPEAPDRRPSTLGASPCTQEDSEAWKKNSGEPRHLQNTPPPRSGPEAGSVVAMVKVEDGWAQTPPVPASCQLSRQGHSPSFTGDSRGVRVPRWGPMTQANRASSSPLEALEACLKGIPSGGPSPLQPLAASWSQSPQPGDVGAQRPELQPQGSHSEEATKEPLLPLGLQGCMREGPIRLSGPRGTPTSFSSTSSMDGDVDFGSPVGTQRQRLGKGCPPGSSPLQGLENCLREISMPRPQAAWSCFSTEDRGLRRAEPRNWTADREGQRGEACEPARLGQSGGEAPTRSINLASPQTFMPSCIRTCQGITRPGSWRWLQDGTATMVSPLHRLENSLKGILPVRPLRFACVTGPGPSPSPCSSSSLSSSDEDPRPEPELWRLPLQERNHMPTCKGPVPLSPVPGASPRGSSDGCPAENAERTELNGSLHAGRTEEGPGGRSQSPRRKEGTECAYQPDLVNRARERRGTEGEGKEEAASHPWPAPQLKERPGPKGNEEPGGLEPGHEQPDAAVLVRTQGKLLSVDPPEPPTKSLPPTAILPSWPPSSLQPLCPCGGALQQELRSLGATLTQKLDQLAAALTGLTQEVATMRTQVNRLERRPRNLRPNGQTSWQWTLPRGPRWANGPGHRRMPYWRQKGPIRPRPKILRAQAEGCRAADRPGLSRGKGYLVPQLPADSSRVEPSGPTCSSSQQSSSPSSHTVTANTFLGHTGCCQSPQPPSVPASLPPLLSSPVIREDTEPLAAGVTAVSASNQSKQPSSLLGDTLREDLWGRDPRWGAH